MCAPGMSAAYEINQEACIGCTACVRVCPTGAISGERKKPHVIQPEVCISCGICAGKCPVKAITQG